MDKAIELLQHELSYAKGNRAECDQSDDFYKGWCESLRCVIGVLQSQNTPPNDVNSTDSAALRG